MEKGFLLTELSKLCTLSDMYRSTEIVPKNLVSNSIFDFCYSTLKLGRLNEGGET